MNSTIRRKLTGTMTPAKIPKARIGMILQKALPKKATEVVEEVIRMALAALLKVYAILFWVVFTTSLSIKPLCFQASKNTNMLSAPIPSTIYIITTYNEPKYLTWSTKSVIRTVIGKLNRMIVTPIREMKKERRWKFR